MLTYSKFADPFPLPQCSFCMDSWGMFVDHYLFFLRCMLPFPPTDRNRHLLNPQVLTALNSHLLASMCGGSSIGKHHVAFKIRPHKTSYQVLYYIIVSFITGDILIKKTKQKTQWLLESFNLKGSIQYSK